MKQAAGPANLPASTGAPRIDAQLWPALSAKFDEAVAMPAAEHEPLCVALAQQNPALADALRHLLPAPAPLAN